MGTREFKKMSKGQSQTRNQPGRRCLGKCRGKEKVNSSVIIDVDNSKEHDFIIVDGPECSKKIFQSSRVSVGEKKSPSSVIISIDDDDDVDELVNSDEGGGDVLRHATRKNVSGIASDQSLSEEANMGHHGSTHESSCPLNVKSKRTYSNRYGLCSDSDSDSDSSSSENDTSDFEVMEGSSGKIREQWERAASKKNIFDHVVNDQSDFKDQACASGPFTDNSENDVVEKVTEHCYRSNNGNGDGLVDDDVVIDSIHKTGINDNKFPIEEDCVSNKRNLDDRHVNHDNFVPVDKDEGLSKSYDSASNGVACSLEKGKAYANFDFGKACFQDKEDVSQDKTELQDTEACGSNSRKSDAAEGDNDIFKTQEEDVGYFQETSYDRSNNGIACPEKEKSVPGETNFCNAQTSHISETVFEEKSSPGNPLLCTNQEGETAHGIQNDLIGGREKYKETAQYKRAMEEEWASRQRELENQAEEVQRLKKRRRAETARLLDMERRQKQRVEEMRQTHKKNVETLNLKEKIRAEVRKELEEIEKLHIDMASLLRYLGINVRGGHHPMPHEVHAAYKQAILKFHPDRASRNDIRQQVEAEEKFKLISRLKVKLLPI